MEHLKQVIYDVVQNVALEKSIEIEHLEAHYKLVDGLGFSSLDLARIVAMLEIKLEVDPFASLVPITSVRTVGDLYAAYAKCIEENGAVKESDTWKATSDTSPAKQSVQSPLQPSQRERQRNRTQRRRRRGEVRRNWSSTTSG